VEKKQNKLYWLPSPHLIFLITNLKKKETTKGSKIGSRAFLMGPVLQFFFSSDFLVRLKSKSLVFEDK